MSDHHSQRHRCRIKPKTLTLLVTLLASLLTVAGFFPYYQQLIAHSCLSVNHIAMRMNDEDALEAFMLTNITMVVKFLATLLPIPVAALVTHGLTRRRRKLL